MSEQDSTSTPPAVDAEETSADMPADQRKPYTSPSLEAYGRLTHLTQNTTNAQMGDGGAAMRMRMSDLRLKQNVVRIGTHPLGAGLYLFNYLPDLPHPLPQGRQFGVLAQEVEELLPEAVSVARTGYKQVDYARLGIHCYQ